MGTRSVIGIQTGPANFETVYCHWDGYRSHNGRILVEAYQTAEKVFALLNEGDISSLDVEIGEQHDFNAMRSDLGPWCTFYRRDRGEADATSKRFTSLKQITEYYSWCEFIYIFDVETLTWKCYNPATWRQLSLKKYQKAASAKQG